MSTSRRQRVFISYAYRDGIALARQLEQDLREHGLDVWLDRLRLRGGAVWSHEIERAIDRSDTCLALLSQGSYESDICRAEQLRSLRRKKCVIPLLVDRGADRPLCLEPRHYLDFSEEHCYWDRFQELLEDIRGQNGAALRKKYRHTYVTAPPLPMNYVERTEALDALRSTVLADTGARHIALTAVKGMGGIGKTILAGALCCDEVIQAAFPDGVIWVSIGEKPEDLVVQMREVAKALGESLHRYDTLSSSSNQLRNALRDKSVLLVLDDVWDPRHVEPFRTDAPSSRLLITTRDARIGAALGAQEHSLDVLSREQSLEFLARWSQRQAGHGFPPEAVEIAYECGRLPLALAMIGAMMRGKPDNRWSSILSALRAADLNRIAQQFPDYKHHTLLRAIQVSVDRLDSRTRQLYLDLAVFPEDTPVPIAALASYWGLETDDVLILTDQFVDLSLAAYDQNGRLTLHDVLLLYMKRTRATRMIRLHQQLVQNYSASCPLGWADGPDDGYFYEHLILHLLQAGRRKEARALLLDFRWLQAKLSSCGAFSLIPDYEYLSDERELELLSSTLRLALLALREDCLALAGQLRSRLLSVESADIQNTLRQAAAEMKAPWLCPLTSSLPAGGGILLLSLEGHGGSVHGVVLSADGRRVVSASQREIIVWDTETGELLQRLKGGVGLYSGNQMAMSADGRRVVAPCSVREFPTELCVWNTDSGSLLCSYGHGSSIDGVTMSADGRRAISTTSAHIHVWNTETGKTLHKYEVPLRAWGRVVASADGREVLSPSLDGNLKIWAAESGALIKSLEIYTSTGRIAPSTDFNRIVVDVNHETLEVWDGETGERLHEITRPEARRVHCIAVSGDGCRFVAGVGDRDFEVWDTESGRRFGLLKGHTDRVVRAAMSADGRRVVSASWDQMVKVWDTEGNDQLDRHEGHSLSVTSVAISADGRLAASGSEDGRAIVWDTEKGSLLYTLEGHSEGVRVVAISDDGGRVFSGSEDKTVRVWDTSTGELLHTLKGHAGSVKHLSASVDGGLAVSGSGYTLRVWDVVTGRLLHTLRGHERAVERVVVSADGHRVVCASSDKTVTVWGTEDGRLLSTFSGHSRSVTDVAVSVDGLRAISGSTDTTLMVWETTNGRLLRTLKGHTGSVRCVAASADGRRAISASTDRTVRVWDTESGDSLQVLGGHTNCITGVAMSADGRYAVSVADDKILRVWNTGVGKEMCSFRADAVCRKCVCSADGKTLLTGDLSGNVHCLELRNA